MSSKTRVEIVELLKDVSEVLRFCARRTKILATLGWEPQVARDFLSAKGTALPKPKYLVDKKGLEEAKEALKIWEPRLQGEHPVLQWLRKTQQSYLDGIALLQNLEKPEFFEVSTRIYGNSKTFVAKGNTTIGDLAKAISNRLSLCALGEIHQSSVSKSSEDFTESVSERIRKAKIPVKVEITDQIVAKVVAGMSRVRVRKDARFSELDIRALWYHEIESHCLTAHNGSFQIDCPFLVSGGPRTTRTQEGIAVFSELYSHALSQERFIALCERVEAISMIESGANFIEIYKWYLPRVEKEIDAFYMAQRLFRGAKLEGGFPFTKDVVYLPGLFEIYVFIQSAMKNQDRLLLESLISGRIALEDVGTIAWLRLNGVLVAPRHIPTWLGNWDALLTFFSFFSVVINAIDLEGFHSYFEEYRNVQEWDLKK